jgi:hypothetical protein
MLHRSLNYIARAMPAAGFAYAFLSHAEAQRGDVYDGLFGVAFFVSRRGAKEEKRAMPTLGDATRSLLPEGYGGQLLERLRQRLRLVIFRSA